ncbi:MAG: outer membrane beta-barrel protein [Cocleimonas sp.]|nr:outer membrane beta-barrel protein [Cocleimonas sp.]
MFLKNKIITSSLLVSALLVSGAAMAKPSKEGQYSVGFQSSWPSYGLSTKYETSDVLTLQATLGALGTVTNLGGRVLYKFKKMPEYDLYGFGSVGVYNYSSGVIDESVFGFGGGVGMEYDLSKELTVNAELGMSIVNFDEYTGYSTVGIGIGLHYWF